MGESHPTLTALWGENKTGLPNLERMLVSKKKKKSKEREDGKKRREGEFQLAFTPVPTL